MAQSDRPSAPADRPSAPADRPATAPSDQGAGKTGDSKPDSSSRTTIDSGKPDVKIDNRTQVGGGDEGSASPRMTTERTTIFGLSPTAAVIIAAALLLVVVLAIVAMTRSNGSYVDNRRL
jgi:hypothetical protein